MVGPGVCRVNFTTSVVLLTLSLRTVQSWTMSHNPLWQSSTSFRIKCFACPPIVAWCPVEILTFIKRLRWSVFFSCSILVFAFMSSYDPVVPLYPICACLGFVLCLVPLPWHIQAWNSGTCAFMIWTATACLIYFIDSLIWAGNVANPVPVWCDIGSPNYLVLMEIALKPFQLAKLWLESLSESLLQSCALVDVSIFWPICRRRPLHATMWAIKQSDYSITSPHFCLKKRRMVFTDLTIAAGFPFLVMSLRTSLLSVDLFPPAHRSVDYIFQGHRFDIYEDFGCYPAIFNTPPTYFLYLMWPLVLGVVSFGYSGAFKEIICTEMITYHVHSHDSSILLVAARSIYATNGFQLLFECQPLLPSLGTRFGRHDVHGSSRSCHDRSWYQAGPFTLDFLGGHPL